MQVQTETSNLVAHRSLDACFSESAQKYPAHPALFVRGRAWSYTELSGKCQAIEQALRAAGLEGSRSNVGLVYGRSAFSYAAMLAIMRSGNVYVPLSARAPADRLLRILADADINTLIIDASDVLSERLLGILRLSAPLRILVEKISATASLESTLRQFPQHTVQHVLEEVDAGVPDYSISDNSPPAAAHVAYIIYTSGSTGVPKGVAISHRSGCHCIEKLYRLLGTSDQDRFTQFSELSFDFSISDVFLCWRSGGTLYVPELSESLVPLSFVASHRITVWSSVPSLANVLLKLGLLKENALSSVRLALFCGEALPSKLAQVWCSAAPGCRIFNLYGPTEVTVFATYYEYDREGDNHEGIVPIGVPLPGVGCMIVDGDRVVEEDDSPGELWLSGDQLAIGYWNDTHATRAAFVSRLSSGAPLAEVWYRTGDLVSRRSGVGLTFRGRSDRQVKLRGYRIELQEVESALREVIGCTLVAVVAPRNSVGMCEKIVAYCDKLDGHEAEIKARCANRMPYYMIPDRILELEVFPLSEHGKVDYLALAAWNNERVQPPANADCSV
jgi:D-alanine--poly(phosphoribitol) ligase subunit 1